MKKLLELYIYIQKKGFKDTAKRIKSRYTKIIKYRINAIDLDDNLDNSIDKIEYAVIIDDLALLENLRKPRDDLPREFYIDKTHGGKKFFLFLLNSEPVYIHWVFGKNEYSKFCNIQDEKTVELQFGYTMPAFRGKQILAKALDYTCQHLRWKGYKRVVNVVSEGNVNCIRGMKASGLKPIAHVTSYFSFIKKVKL
ncbi:MAG: hypothetical protein C4548_09500 [Desulfobacteraceae bacterium]|nr:MAG: hypothetical protein C4548_09500 [Desulfobacteraceae bacterium]